MRHSPSRLVTFALLLPTLASAQVPPPPDSLLLRDRGSPEESLGIFTARGRVAFTIAPDGRPDSTSLRVTEVAIVSAAARP